MKVFYSDPENMRSQAVGRVTRGPVGVMMATLLTTATIDDTVKRKLEEGRWPPPISLKEIKEMTAQVDVDAAVAEAAFQATMLPREIEDAGSFLAAQGLHPAVHRCSNGVWWCELVNNWLGSWPKGEGKTAIDAVQDAFKSSLYQRIMQKKRPPQ